MWHTAVGGTRRSLDDGLHVVPGRLGNGRIKNDDHNIGLQVSMVHTGRIRLERLARKLVRYGRYIIVHRGRHAVRGTEPRVSHDEHAFHHRRIIPLTERILYLHIISYSLPKKEEEEEVACRIYSVWQPERMRGRRRRCAVTLPSHYPALYIQLLFNIILYFTSTSLLYTDTMRMGTVII